MNFENAKELFKEININLSQDEFSKFELYAKELLYWNEKINLTSITDDNEIWLKHFVDSSSINKYLTDNCTLIDVGTGAGFPGIPNIILNSSIKLTLLDSLNKRIDFLKSVCNSLSIDNVTFIHGRSEDYGNDENYREQYDFVTARAVASLNVLCEYCLPFLKIGGKFICMKSIKVDEEIKDAKNAITKLGGKIVSIDSFNLPKSEIQRSIIVIEKVKETPSIYPRKAGIPTKNPIL